jgi:hypothetical protein
MAEAVLKKQQAKKKRAGLSEQNYAKHKQKMVEVQRKVWADSRDIGSIPAPADPKRRDACSKDFGKFCKTYFPGTFRHSWSPVHKRLIEMIELVIRDGALLAMGIPRGWGKTSLCVRAVIWAVAYRYHTFAMLIGASHDAAKQMIMDIRSELENNDLLGMDFPELCYPIRALEGINQRGKAQTCGGKRTRVFGSDFELRLGDVAGQSGAIIRSGGILSSKIRGCRHVVEDRVLRPTLGLVDDPQTRQGASSPRSRHKCERIVQADLPGLPGAGEAWSCLMTMTVVEPDDVADRVLDREKHPSWHGVRHSALDGFPTAEAMELWQEWNQIREECLRNDKPLEPAHKFYRKHKKAMQAGVKVVWKDGYDREQFVDPLEQAMDWYFRDQQGFWSELMNDPASFKLDARPELDREAVALRVNHLKHGELPVEAEFLTAFIDCQQTCLWYEVRAHATDSSSWVIDYNTWPQQKRDYFTLHDIRVTFDDMYPAHQTIEARLRAAIKDVGKYLFDRKWMRKDGHQISLNVAAVDANWETEAVKRAVRNSGYAGRLIPSHGSSFRPPKRSINDLQKKPGDRAGDYWRLKAPQDKQEIRHLSWDVDYWKAWNRDRLLIPQDASGAITLYGGRQHRMWADHQLAEVSTRLQDMSTKREVEIFTIRPDRPDNHLLDCSVGNAMLGNMLGCSLENTERQKPKTKRRKGNGGQSRTIW